MFDAITSSQSHCGVDGCTIPSCVYCHSRLVGVPDSGSPAGLFFKLL